MKKIVYSIVVLVVTALTLSAQTAIPNGSFESWSDIGNGMVNPDGWDTANEFVDIAGIFQYTFNGTMPDLTTQIDGTTSAKLVTNNNTLVTTPVTLPGLLTLGDFQIDFVSQTGSLTGGIAIDAKPVKLRGYYKYTPVGADSCQIWLGAWTSDGTIGEAWHSTSTVSDWTLFEIPVEYTLDTIPDSLNIIIVSSDTTILQVGSTAWIDSLTVIYDNPVGVTKANQSNLSVGVYPNPATDYTHVTVLNLNRGTANIRLFNTLGKMVLSKTTDQENTRLDISDLPSGLYLVKVNAGKQEKVHKLFIR